jgi:hypothetical protein
MLEKKINFSSNLENQQDNFVVNLYNSILKDRNYKRIDSININNLNIDIFYYDS